MIQSILEVVDGLTSLGPSTIVVAKSKANYHSLGLFHNALLSAKLPNARVHTRRLMIAPVGVGCNALLDSTHFTPGLEQG